MSEVDEVVVLCPGQGAQAVGMGRAWAEASPAAREVFDEADAVLGPALGAKISGMCFEGPADRLARTDISQPALYTCGVACWRGVCEREGSTRVRAAAGLSLGEYTALHLAGVFGFAEGLRLVAARGRLMQEAAEGSRGGMLALVGAEEAQARERCAAAAGEVQGQVLVPANFNAPGQIVLSGHAAACGRAAEMAAAMGLRATPLAVAGAFHSPLMQGAAERMGEVLAGTRFERPNLEVWSNVTAAPHDPDDTELLRRRLVEQIVRPVKWCQICQGLPAGGTIAYRALAPGSVLKALMRRTDRSKRVKSHDQPTTRTQHASP